MRRLTLIMMVLTLVVVAVVFAIYVVPSGYVTNLGNDVVIIKPPYVKPSEIQNITYSPHVITNITIYVKNGSEVLPIVDWYNKYWKGHEVRIMFRKGKSEYFWIVEIHKLNSSTFEIEIPWGTYFVYLWIDNYGMTKDPVANFTFLIPMHINITLDVANVTFLKPSKNKILVVIPCDSNDIALRIGCTWLSHVLSNENVKKINKLFRMSWEVVWLNKSRITAKELINVVLNETPATIFILAHGSDYGVCLANPVTCYGEITVWILTEGCDKDYLLPYEYEIACPIALKEFYPKKVRTRINFLTCFSCTISKRLVDNNSIDEVKCYKKYYVFMANLSKNPLEDFYSAITLMPPMSSFSNFMFFKSNNLYKAYEIEKMLYPYLSWYVSIKKPKYWQDIVNVLNWDKEQLKYLKSN